MKILYITSTPLEYSSSANMRNIALISGLIKNGNDVYTLSYVPDTYSSYYNKELLAGINLKKRYFINLGKIHSKFTTKNDNNNIRKKIKSIIYKIYVSFKIYDSRKDIVNKINKVDIKEEFDIIISSSDPKSSHLLAEKIIKKYPNITKRWIQYWGDPFLRDINIKTKAPKVLVKKTEENLLKKCNKVVYVSPFTLEEQKKLYKELSDKLYFLPIPYLKEKIYDETKNQKIQLGYFGDYYSMDRTIEPLYRAIQGQDIILNICGNSDFQLKSCDNINVLKRQKIEKIEELEKNTDILVCVCNKRGTQIPGKIYHYAATNKPILILLDGDKKQELKKYFETFNRYEICDNIEKDILCTIDKIIKEKHIYKPLQTIAAQTIAEEFIK